jgi:sortase A
MPRLRIRYNYDEPASAKLWLRWICLVGACACFAWGGWVWLEQRLHQQQAQESFEELIRDPAPAKPAAPHDRDHPLAKLEIARLGVSGYVEDGFDSRTLGRAIGHSPRSAKPGEHGNVVLAAHRDTFFAGLRDVKVGDVVDMQASTGRHYRYKVSRVFVVDPKDSWVMQSSPRQDMLTMITCYPFHFVGNAPNRLVVQAQPIRTAVVARRRHSKPRA